MTVRLAVAQYPVLEHVTLTAWGKFVTDQVGEAAENGAEFLLFPEYGAMDMVALLETDIRRSLSRQIVALQDLLPDFLRLFTRLSAQRGLWIVAPSFPVRVGAGYRNRAYVFGPEGQQDYQEKLIMTRFEREVWMIEAGTEPKVFHSNFGIFGINICYDVEFPLISRSQARSGAKLILAPSCTDTVAGYYRVRVGAQARALENQCFVAQSPTVGLAPWTPAVDENHGAAAVFCPPDRGFPDNGVLSIGDMNSPGWVYATLDLDKITRTRAQGQVLNHRDWPEQQALAPARAVKLTPL